MVWDDGRRSSSGYLYSFGFPSLLSRRCTIFWVFLVRCADRRFLWCSSLIEHLACSFSEKNLAKGGCARRPMISASQLLWQPLRAAFPSSIVCYLSALCILDWRALLSLSSLSLFPLSHIPHLHTNTHTYAFLLSQLYLHFLRYAMTLRTVLLTFSLLIVIFVSFSLTSWALVPLLCTTT